MPKKIIWTFFSLLLIFSVSNAEAKKKPKDIGYVTAKLVHLEVAKDKVGKMGFGSLLGGVGMGIGAVADMNDEYYKIQLLAKGRIYHIIYSINSRKAKKYRPNWAVGDMLQVAFDEAKSDAYMRLFDSERHIKAKIIKRVRP
ncbi:MAG: hypothetical protein H7A32_05590 [Deltaproteobacteria bacterium]|nr:hypothetical protein [Deltaproteobacteria bacterium]